MQLDHDGRALAVHRGEVLAEAAPAGPDGDHVGEPGARGPDAAQLGPGVLDHADRRHGGERDADVAVEALGLLHRAQVEHELAILDAQVGHGGSV